MNHGALGCTQTTSQFQFKAFLDCKVFDIGENYMLPISNSWGNGVHGQQAYGHLGEVTMGLV